MRASELLGAQVVTDDGRSVGHVTGLRCTLDGPAAGPLNAPRLRELVVSRRLTGAYLGYGQADQRGPALVRWIVELMHRTSRQVAWSDVADVRPGEIRLTGTWSP
jgi:hypothetical protein